LSARRRLPAAVVALGLVSLFTDASSEMIIPLLPAFLVTLGASATMMGLIDGVAETTSAMLKLGSGVWADRVRRRKPLVLFGYGLASLARPLIALAQTPLQVLGIRFVDRIGKGVRSSPRDALIAEAAAPEQRGAAFGFHRAMDHTGALVGPLLAFGLVWLGLSTRAVFALAAIPAALAVVTLALFVREVPREPALPQATGAPAARAPLPPALRRYLVVLAIFTLASSTDFFLLLRAHELGVPDVHAPLLWALLHLVKSTLSTPLGALSDRLPRRRLILAGWLVYALVYGAFGLARAPWHIWALFLVYGLYAAACEGAEKALVADLAPAAARGRAFGWFNFTVGLCALPASLAFGIVWDRVGHAAAFFTGASLAAVAGLGLLLVGRAAVSSPESGRAG
jgi:MFS family permease